MTLTYTHLRGPEANKSGLVDTLSTLPGVSREYAFRLIDDVEAWSLDHARFAAKDVTPLVAPQLQRAVKQAIAPTLWTVVLFGVATSVVSLAALVSIRRTRRAIERKR